MKTIFPFLRDLKIHNNRDWFQANKSSWETAKAELEDALSEIIPGIAAFDSSAAGQIPKNCIFRINRDVRFSNDKSPYKTNAGAVIAPGGRKSRLGSYYIHLDPEGSFLAGGVYMPQTGDLSLIRQEIDYNLEEFEAILNKPSFKKYFSGLDDNGRLKTAPKGYEPDNPAIEHLKNKSFTVSCMLKREDVESADFVKKSLEIFKELYPLNRFLSRALDKS